VVFQHEDAAACKKAFASRQAVADGVMLARDLVNEPANILGPVEFAARAEALSALGVEVDILTEKEMKKLGMGALLGVAQGSVRPPRLAVMKWNGGKAKDKPIAFIGKGVVFDTGGISMKPAGGMEDMKGDMGGAAAVTGLMHTLAARKAKVNVIGIIGLVENMPDGNAQRPGDIVTSMSGQTIEVINTDAEGRLVLCDALWYCKETFKPKFMINLATLTGAIMVALGQHHAGLFSNDDEAVRATGCRGKGHRRAGLAHAYGAGIRQDDRFQVRRHEECRRPFRRRDHGGAVPQALCRRCAWAHLDVAGTAMSSPSTDINQSWASGYGVRLLDRAGARQLRGLTGARWPRFLLSPDRIEARRGSAAARWRKALERGWRGDTVHGGSEERCVTRSMRICGAIAPTVFCRMAAPSRRMPRGNRCCSRCNPKQPMALRSALSPMAPMFLHLRGLNAW
jgi:leucyl aminopeptidase